MSKGGLSHHDIRTCVGSEYDEDGILGVQCEPNGANGDCPSIEFHMPLGLIGRPLDPDDDGLGSQIHTYYEGSRMHATPSGDARAYAKLPKFPKGTTGTYGYSGGYAVFLPDGTLLAYVPERDAAGNVTKAHVIEVKPGAAITVRHGGGAGVVLSDDEAIMHAPDGQCSIECKKGGSGVLNGNWKVTGFLSGPNPIATPILQTTTTPATFISGF